MTTPHVAGRFILSLVVVLVCVVQTQATSQSSAAGSIAGAVRRSDTGEPAANVRVTLSKVIAEQPRGRLYERPTAPPVNPTFMTDAAGHFTFRDLAPGAYKLTFEANGFVRQEYGQRIFPGEGKSITLAPDEARSDINISMTPTSSIRGRV